MKFVSLIQQVNINEKIANAPNTEYQIGVLIGSFIPVVFLACIAYWMYNRMKNRQENH